jgi:hypothetical protein
VHAPKCAQYHKTFAPHFRFCFFLPFYTAWHQLRYHQAGELTDGYKIVPGTLAYFCAVFPLNPTAPGALHKMKPLAGAKIHIALGLQESHPHH